LSRDCIAYIDGTFIVHLRDQGLSEKTIAYDRCAIRRAARFLAQKKRPLDSLTVEELPAFLRESLPGPWRSSHSRERYARAIRHWLRFRYPACVLPVLRAPVAPGRSFPKLFHGKPVSSYPWHRWVDDYLQFLDAHRGLSWKTRREYGYIVRDYLFWQFGERDADWTRVTPSCLWRYAREFVRGRKPATLNRDLRIMRLFLDFAHMRAACSVRLVHAVPRFANYGHAYRREVLNDTQRRQLLACFERSSFEGARDYAMALCMVDLGLRPQEVVLLDCDNIDLGRATLDIPPTKTDWGRRLPVPNHVIAALRAYLRWRPRPSTCTRLFIRVYFSGHHVPIKTHTLCQTVNKAYQKCGFSWEQGGGYHLRHTFASRLFAHGAELKQIADLMGHRHLQTTMGYTRVDINALRPLALPWPK
jgi:site-specific recombinase XerD